MHLSRSLLALAGLAVLAASCGAAPSSPVASADSETVTSSSTPAASAVPAQSETRVGHAQTHKDGGVEAEITALRMRQPFPVVIPVSPRQPERKGHEYAAIEVKFCLTKNTMPDPVTVSWSPWSLAFRDGTVVEALTSWSAAWWDVPLYPQDYPVKVGRCVRGWIPFEVSKGSKPERVTYAPTGGAVLEWRVS